MRFGYDWFKPFCEQHGTQMTRTSGEAFSPEAELVVDVIEIVTVFSAKLHGLRSQKHVIRAAALRKGGSDDQGA